jgi:hypothetical protein
MAGPDITKMIIDGDPDLWQEVGEFGIDGVDANTDDD